MTDASPHRDLPPAPEPATADGASVQACRGVAGCPHAAPDFGDLDPARLALLLGADIAAELERLDMGRRLRRLHGRPLRHHEAFTVSVSCCPNACSRPQIADVGFIGAARPVLDPAACTACGACLEACRERALIAAPRGNIEAVDTDACLSCGACLRVCPSGALAPAATGFRVQAGGRLGRHPRLAEELPGLAAPEELPAVVGVLARLLLERGRPGERLADVLERLPAGAAAEAVTKARGR